MSTGRVVLHIDRLALRGFPREQREALVAGLRATLERQLALPAAAARLEGLPAQRERVDAGRVALDHGLPAGAAGARLGRGIARSLGR